MMLWKMTLFMMTIVSASLCAITYQPNEIQAKRPLEASKLADDPFAQFKQWYTSVKEELGAQKAGVAILSTASKAGVPSARAMEVNGIEKNDLTFFGDLRSQKFQDLNENPEAAVTFNWLDQQKQVRISGKMILISTQETHEVFNNEQKLAQITALASNQDEPIDHFHTLESKHAALVEKYENSPIAKPTHWGGYRMAPQKIEFWQAGAHALHSRVVYEKKKGRWVKTTLSP